MEQIINTVMSFIPGGSLTAILVAISAGLVALWGVFAKVKKSGRDEVLAEQKRQDDEVLKKFDQIDKQSPDLDASLDRLRKRSGMPK